MNSSRVVPAFLYVGQAPVLCLAPWLPIGLLSSVPMLCVLPLRAVEMDSCIFQALRAHRAHVRVFQSLRLCRAQKEGFAALWYGWKQRRHALDQDFAVTLSMLSSLPCKVPCQGSCTSEDLEGGARCSMAPGALAAEVVDV